jgi:3-deoxy-D-manno-octulosonate 8-phosphate phosphatase (KDO 8-P phosphatase)
MVTLALDELRARAKRIRLVVTDVDGTLTDAGVYYSERGEELKRFSLRDGMGVELLRKAGLPTAMLTREKSSIVEMRAKKLRIEHVYGGVEDKLAFLPELTERTGVAADAIAYIGDDVNDVDVMKSVALAGAPGDAADAARAVAHKITNAPGGHGAFREFSDWILLLRGNS